MKKDIHPDYRPVVFQDVSTGYTFLTRSTIETDRTIQWEDGKEYPLLRLEISSSSHPFYTGTQRLLDSAGRVERFERRYARGTPGDSGGVGAAGEGQEGPTRADATPEAEEPVDAEAGEA